MISGSKCTGLQIDQQVAASDEIEIRKRRICHAPRKRWIVAAEIIAGPTADKVAMSFHLMLSFERPLGAVFTRKGAVCNVDFRLAFVTASAASEKPFAPSRLIPARCESVEITLVIRRVP